MSQVPYTGQFWANTQKHTVMAYHDRWLLLGAIIGSDEELQFVRKDRTALATAFQAEATVASQTVLHLVQEDTRDCVILKLTDKGGGAGNLIEARDADGNLTGRLTSAGTFTDGSSEEIKTGLQLVTEEFTKKVLNQLNIYSYEYKFEPGVQYVSPVAEEFHGITGLGDKRSIAAKSIGSIALKACQLIWAELKGIRKDIAAIKERLGAPPAEDSSGDAS